MTAKTNDEHDEQTKVLSGVSSSQVVGGALAAMTAAVAGSWLGVAGTLIGAAVGSVVATIAGTIYTNSLRKSRRLAQAARLTTRAALANRAADGGRGTAVLPTSPDAAQALAEAQAADGSSGGVLTAEDEPSTDPDPSRRTIPWRAAAVAAVVSLLLALGGIWAYEKVAGHPIGSSDKPGTTFSNVRSGDSGDTGGSGDQDRDDGPSQQQSPDDSTPSPTPSTDDGSTPSPEVEPDQPSTTPAPTAPTTPSPSPAEPTPGAGDGADEAEELSQPTPPGLVVETPAPAPVG